MHIYGKVGDVDGFRLAYNDFIMSLVKHYKQAGNGEFAWDLRLELVIQRLPAKVSLAWITPEGEKHVGVTVQLRARDGKRGEFIVDCDNEELRPHFEDFWRKEQQNWGDEEETVIESESASEHKQETLWLPTEPPMAGHEGYTRDDIFDWWHRGGKLFIPHIKDLAHYLGVAPRTVRNLHSDYMTQHPDGKKPESKSHFAGMALPPIKGE